MKETYTLGIYKINPVKRNELVELVKDFIKRKKRLIIANHNFNSLYHMPRNKDMKEFYKKADITIIDGIPVMWIFKIKGAKINSYHRLGTIDYAFKLFSEAEKNKWKIFYLGSTSKSGEEALKKLKKIYPNLKIYIEHGYFSKENSKENNKIIKNINRLKIKILFVGMGMPEQEIWLNKNLKRLPNCIIINCGAFIDFASGQKKIAPNIMRRIGLEWLFRLINEPKRLWKRYLIEPWYVIPYLIRNKLQKI